VSLARLSSDSQSRRLISQRHSLHRRSIVLPSGLVSFSCSFPGFFSLIYGLSNPFITPFFALPGPITENPLASPPIGLFPSAESPPPHHPFLHRRLQLRIHACNSRALFGSCVFRSSPSLSLSRHCYVKLKLSSFSFSKGPSDLVFFSHPCSLYSRVPSTAQFFFRVHSCWWLLRFGSVFPPPPSREQRSSQCREFFFVCHFNQDFCPHRPLVCCR